jgi:hypothetical protein
MRGLRVSDLMLMLEKKLSWLDLMWEKGWMKTACKEEREGCERRPRKREEKEDRAAMKESRKGQQRRKEERMTPTE